MSLIRIPFVISALLAIYATVTPPHVASSSANKLKPTGLEKFMASALPAFVKAVYGFMAAAEVAVIIAHANPSSSISAQALSLFVRNDADSVLKIRVSVALLLGWLLSLAGTLLRLKCYHLLGRFFTFELAIHKDHRLVTSGPYAWVRHPSYTGAVTAGIGIAMCHLGPGSWLIECSGIIGPGAVPYIWTGGCAIVLLGFWSRTRKEDAMMREQFGAQWEAWASNVGYKLVPGVF